MNIYKVQQQSGLRDLYGKTFLTATAQSETIDELDLLDGTSPRTEASKQSGKKKPKLNKAIVTSLKLEMQTIMEHFQQQSPQNSQLSDQHNFLYTNKNR